MNEIWRVGQIEGIPEPTGPWNWSVGWNGLVFISGIRGIDLRTGQPADGDERRLELIFDHMRRILDQRACRGRILERSDFGLIRAIW